MANSVTQLSRPDAGTLYCALCRQRALSTLSAPFVSPLLLSGVNIHSNTRPELMFWVWNRLCKPFSRNDDYLFTGKYVLLPFIQWALHFFFFFYRRFMKRNCIQYHSGDALPPSNKYYRFHILDLHNEIQSTISNSIFLATKLFPCSLFPRYPSTCYFPQFNFTSPFLLSLHKDFPVFPFNFSLIIFLFSCYVSERPLYIGKQERQQPYEQIWTVDISIYSQRLQRLLVPPHVKCFSRTGIFVSHKYIGR